MSPGLHTLPGHCTQGSPSQHMLKWAAFVPSVAPGVTVLESGGAGARPCLAYLHRDVAGNAWWTCSLSHSLTRGFTQLCPNVREYLLVAEPPLLV